MPTVKIKDSGNGRIFAGIGGITSNGMSKLLMEYPVNQRNDILDFLFLPNHGAGLQILKIEIGSDANSSAGTEPGHMRSSVDFDITRGVGLWMAKEAKSRNPQIILDAIRWGTPRWIKSDTDKYLFYKNFLQGARDVYGLEFDYLAPDENEGAFSRNYVVNTLRPMLDRDGFSNVKLTAADSNVDWNIAVMVNNDHDLKKSLYAINAHYMQDSPDSAKNCGLPVFNSEDLAPFRNNFGACLNFAHRIIQSYSSGKMVMYQIHPVIEAVYDNVPFTCKGIISAAHPWSGHYEIDKGLWVLAHFTQFVKPGWRYIDSGCLGGEYDSYLTLKSQISNDISIVILNRGAEKTDYRFELPDFSGRTFYVWMTDSNNQFYRTPDINAASGVFDFVIPPQTICTLTTTAGQKKGAPKNAIPANTELTLPYADDFRNYLPGKQPRYTVDQSGAFEIVREGKNNGNCLKQIITHETKPIDWELRVSPLPYTILGDLNWKNYRVSMDFFLETMSESNYDGYVLLGARCNLSPAGKAAAECYNIKIYHDGHWRLCKASQILTCGAISNFSLNVWHTLEISTVDSEISVLFNNSFLTKFNDIEIPSGHVVIGSGYNPVKYANLQISPIDIITPVSCKRYQENSEGIVYTGTWTKSGTDAKNYNRSLVVSKNAGDTMEFSFNGAAVSVLGVLGPDCGLADIFIDGSLISSIDTYSNTQKWRKSIFCGYKLLSGNHRLKLEVKGRKNSFSSNTCIYINAIEITDGQGLYFS